MVALPPQHTRALVLACEHLIDNDTSGLPVGRLTARVVAARDEIIRGYELMAADLPAPAQFVDEVLDLARQDIAHLAKPGRQRGITAETSG